ncbi:uncharacterized protein LOC113387997 [Ctenocephalides felis]|uniref:uncharacterized protein LOC113387997 n=1 Tax=Ctenocephalides felis TaxID=7515 RepID=UPI000E6E41F9|nr:uncharacterized protein LOC113387997 [Ctenocephalides felis]
MLVAALAGHSGLTGKNSQGCMSGGSGKKIVSKAYGYDGVYHDVGMDSKSLKSPIETMDDNRSGACTPDDLHQSTTSNQATCACSSYHKTMMKTETKKMLKTLLITTKMSYLHPTIISILNTVLFCSSNICTIE